MTSDTIRDAVIAAAEKRGLSARAVALAAAADNITVGHVQRYFAGTSDMSGQRLQHVLRAVGLRIVAAEQ